MPVSVLLTKQQYKVLPSELAKVCQELDEYLIKGWVHLSTSLYEAPILFYMQKGWVPLYVYRLLGIYQMNEI